MGDRAGEFRHNAGMGIRRLVAVTLALAVLALSAGRAWAGEGGAVTLYVSADEHIVRPVVAAFEAETGLKVRVVGDTEATKALGLAQRLRAERDAPRADVFWNSEAFLTAALAREGLLAPLAPEAAKGWRADLTGEGGLWHGFGMRARVLVFNTGRVPAEEAPRCMHDLLAPRFAGKVAMARPQFGTTRGHMSALVAWWGEDAARSWLKGMKAGGLRLVDGNSAVVRAVAQGEADVGLTDTDDAWAAKRNGWPLEMVFLRHDLPADADGAHRGALRVGAMLIPNTVAVVAGGPNPPGGQRLAAFLLSERVERMLAESESKNIPARAGLAEQFKALAPPEPAPIDIEKVSASMPRAMRIVREELGG